MDIPKPHPPVKKVEQSTKDVKQAPVKRPFVPKPHLTVRPFADLKTKLNSTGK